MSAEQMGILAGFFATIGIVIKGFFDKFKGKADSADVITQAASRLIVDYQKRIEELEKRNQVLEERVTAAEEKADRAAEAEHRCNDRMMELEREMHNMKLLFIKMGAGIGE